MDELVSKDNVTKELVQEEPGTGLWNGATYVVMLISLVLLILLTCGANLAVMVCTRVDVRLRRPTNLYVFSLAVADLIVGLCVMSSMAVYTLTGYWPLGQKVCTAWVIFDFTCCTVSMLHLCLVAHDRYMALSRPMKYRHPNRTKYIIALITLAWIIGVLAWVPAILYYRYTDEPIELDCYFFPDRKYILIQSILVYYTPILILVYFYTMCVRVLHSQYRRVKALESSALPQASEGRTQASDGANPVPSEPIAADHMTGQDEYSYAYTDVNTMDTTVPGNSIKQGNSFRKKKSQRRHQEHVRTIRTLGFIIVTFLVCWLPFCILWPVSAYCNDCIPPRVYEYSYWSAYINSTLNPTLYFLCNKDFRSAFMKLLRKLKVCLEK